LVKVAAVYNTVQQADLERSSGSEALGRHTGSLLFDVSNPKGGDVAELIDLRLESWKPLQPVFLLAELSLLRHN